MMLLGRRGWHTKMGSVGKCARDWTLPGVFSLFPPNGGHHGWTNPLRTAFHGSTVKGYDTKLHVDTPVVAKNCRANPILYAMRAKVEEEFGGLVKEGLLEPVQCADWLHQYSLCSSKMALFMCLYNGVASGKWFTKLDMRQVYQQLQPVKSSQEYVRMQASRKTLKATVHVPKFVRYYG